MIVNGKQPLNCIKHINSFKIKKILYPAGKKQKGFIINGKKRFFLKNNNWGSLLP